MTEEMQQALKKETERYIAENILYDDVYVGQFNEKDGADCALHAVEWYRNNVWHKMKENANPKLLVVLSDDEGNISRKLRWPFAEFIRDSKKKGINYTKWAYLEDLLPAQQSSPSS